MAHRPPRAVTPWSQTASSSLPSTPRQRASSISPSPPTVARKIEEPPHASTARAQTWSSSLPSTPRQRASSISPSPPTVARKNKEPPYASTLRSQTTASVLPTTPRQGGSSMGLSPSSLIPVRKSSEEPPRKVRRVGLLSHSRAKVHAASAAGKTSPGLQRKGETAGSKQRRKNQRQVKPMRDVAEPLQLLAVRLWPHADESGEQCQSAGLAEELSSANGQADEDTSELAGGSKVDCLQEWASEDPAQSESGARENGNAACDIFRPNVEARGEAITHSDDGVVGTSDGEDLEEDDRQGPGEVGQVEEGKGDLAEEEYKAICVAVARRTTDDSQKVNAFRYRMIWAGYPVDPEADWVNPEGPASTYARLRQSFWREMRLLHGKSRFQLAEGSPVGTEFRSSQAWRRKQIKKFQEESGMPKPCPAGAEL